MGRAWAAIIPWRVPGTPARFVRSGSVRRWRRRGLANSCRVTPSIATETATATTKPPKPRFGTVSANTRQNAENEYIPVAVARNNAAVNAGPRVCWENTAITLPSTGNTASKPLQRSPTVLASMVTTSVSAAPAIIRQTSLSDFGAGPLTTGCTLGNRYGAESRASQQRRPRRVTTPESATESAPARPRPIKKLSMPAASSPAAPPAHK